ncbi:MAG: hypothetical protein O6941_08665 [Planctomycetota bacterium]|nr:hypothetical protein [Planctomycetota bacterium]
MTDTDTTASADSLIHLLQQQQDLVGQLGRLASRQGALIGTGRADALLGLLSQRQEIMDQFVRSQERFAQFTESVCSGDVGYEQRERISMLVDSISCRLSQIMRCDEKDRDALRVNRDQTRQELAGLGTAKRAHRAYVKPRAPSPRFADQEG